MPTSAVDRDPSSLLEASAEVVLRGDTLGAVRLAHAAWRGASNGEAGGVASRLALLEGYAGNIRHAARWVAEADGNDVVSMPGSAELAIGRDIVALETQRASLTFDPTHLRDGHKLWPLAFWNQGRSELRSGNAFGALELARTAQSVTPSPGRTPFGRHMISILHAEAAWAMGDIGRARQSVKDVPASCTAATGVRMRLSLALDGATEARRHSFWLAAQCQATPRARIPILLGRAVAELEARPDHAQQTADEAAALIERSGLSGDIHAFPAEAINDLADQSEQLAQHVTGTERPTRPTWPKDVQPVRLTPTELTVLRMLPRSADQQDLAERLFLSHNTVKTHLRNLYAKLSVHTRDEAIEKAVTLGLFHTE